MTNQDFNEILSQVQMVDDSYSLILTDVKYFSNPEFEFQNAIQDMIAYLNSMIRAINGVDEELDVRGIIHMSKLKWKQKQAYDVDSHTYRCRFLTLLLTEVSSNLSTLCERMYRYESPGVGIYEHGYFYLLEIRKILKEFIFKFLQGNAWRQEIIPIVKISYFLRIHKKVRMENMITGTDQLFQELRDGCYQNRIVKPLLDESTQIDYLFRFAILICTQTGRCENVPKVKSYKNKKTGVDSFRYEVAWIGKTILTEPGDYRKTNLLFQIFWDSMPYCKYGFDKLEENPYLQMGCKALEFINFILDDACCSALIDKLLERQGWS